ncbi:MAG: 7-cyano-7-deazaguanine synthase QueC [Opitutales bacterium]|jgi:7-cyano-7-deazaguanine synthase|nr:7-cyano-7-deazaguanine synthase QueC [Opitutales bacterium]
MKTVIVYSGGLDSTVLLYHLLATGDSVSTLAVNYGQRHSKELKQAKAITSKLGIEHREVDLTSINQLLGGSSLTDSSISIPQGHYEEDNMKSTVVPNRNMILLSLATGWAVSKKAECVSYAAHSGDHAIYPDCRNEFAEALDKAIRLADWQEVYLNRPFVDLTKADIVKLGSELNVPFEQTWSCYEGQDVHCGRCGTCIERREAFHLAGVEDPTEYRADAPTLEVMISNDWRLN